jgi:hypothetical protein
MLVTFHSKASGDVTMFGDVAVTLLKLAGHSGTVPGAILAGDIPSALARLKQEITAAGSEEADGHDPGKGADDPDTPPPVGLRLRAWPLIQLLSTAAEQGCDVKWEGNKPSA